MVSLLAFLFIRNLGPFAGLFSADLGEVFSALKNAAVIPAFAFPAFFFCVYFLIRRKKGRRPGILVLFIFISFLLAVFFSRVNSVYFCDVAVSLLKLVKNGVLNEL